MFFLKNYNHIYAFKWHLHCNNSQIYISSTDITLELQSYVLSCLPDIHLNLSEKNKNLLGPNLNSPFPLTIISLKSLYLCHSFRKWHAKVILYSVLNLKFYSTPLAIPTDSILILNFSYGQNLHGSHPSLSPQIVFHDYLKDLLVVSSPSTPVE